MNEAKFPERRSQAEHPQNAERFRGDVIGKAIPRFPDLQITAVNETQESGWLSPLAGYEARLQAAFETQIAVLIKGDEAARIKKATSFINNLANQNRGRGRVKRDDGGIVPDQTRESLERVLGHEPKREDLPLFARYLDYFFSDK